MRWFFQGFLIFEKFDPTIPFLKLFFIFNCARSALQRELFSSGERLLSARGVQASHCSALSCRAQPPGHAGSAAAPQLQSAGSTAEAHELSSSSTCGIILDQGLNLGLLHWQADSLPLSHLRGKPPAIPLKKHRLWPPGSCRRKMGREHPLSLSLFFFFTN